MFSAKLMKRFCSQNFSPCFSHFDFSYGSFSGPSFLNWITYIKFLKSVAYKDVSQDLILIDIPWASSQAFSSLCVGARAVDLLFQSQAH